MLCHFLKPELCLQSTDGTMAKPPSHTLKEAFRELNGRELSDEDIRRLSKSTLLPPDEVVMWIEHLQTTIGGGVQRKPQLHGNRKRPMKSITFAFAVKNIQI